MIWVLSPRVEPTCAVIPARSKQQALDWSLVLVSQGIDCTIERAVEDGRWQLLVERNQCQQAIQALRQYKTENRTPSWRATVPGTGLLFDWRSAAWFLLVIVIFGLGENPQFSLVRAGVMDCKAVWAGQWWRLFTAITLHRDVAHLASNVTTGMLLLGLAMGSFGPGIGLLSAYLTGVAGNLARLLLYGGPHSSLGASGMVFGALGLITGQMFVLLRGGISGRQLTIRAVLSGVLLLVLFGFSPETDVIAHIGGFVAGVLFGGLLVLFPNRLAESMLANRLAELICAALVIWTWWAALRS